MTVTLKLTSLNICGINNNIKKKRLLSLTKRLKTDILLLQEMHQKKADTPILNKHHFPYQIQAPGLAQAWGTAILKNKTHHFQEKDTLKDKEGRYVITKGQLNNETMTIASIYVPNDGQIQFLDGVFSRLRDFSEGFLLVTGDFNYVVDIQLDRTYKRDMARLLTSHTYTALQDLFIKYGLID